MASFAHLTSNSDVGVCRFVITELGVASIPASALYTKPESKPKMVRFCFAKLESTLAEAGERLDRLKFSGSLFAAD